MLDQAAYLTNTAFSQVLPKLQLAWDSVSLGALKTCPRFYELSIIEGWEPKQKSVHLEFGLWMHSGRERYYHGRAAGKSHEQSIRIAVQYVLLATWDKRLSRPWASDDPNKNRLTLLRSLVWYLDQWQDDPMETTILADGRPAVELTFKFDCQLRTSHNEAFLLCGHLDRVGVLDGHTFLSDLKTTKHTIKGFSAAEYFAQFSPDNQMSLYDFSANVVYSLPVQGLIVDAVQVAATFTRFHRSPVARSEAQREEWYEDLRLWLASAEMYAKLDRWPMNDKACFRCQFRPICAKPPAARDIWLKAKFQRRVWNPLVERGDI